MEDHLNPLGASFLYLEEPTTVMHVGSVLVLDPGPGGLDMARFTDLVAARVGGATRYRQKVRELPGRWTSPFWVDAADFDISYHLRRAALPKPGTQEQLEEFVARILSRPLDRAHPLWELYVVEGLEGGRVAIVTKTHQALVDGVSAVDIAQLILDEDPDVRPQVPQDPPPRREPTDLELLAATALDVITRPSRWAGVVTGGVAEVASMAGHLLGQTKDVASAVARTATHPAPASPLNARVGSARRVLFVPVPLADFRVIRDAYRRDGQRRETNVTDVILTVLTGALRSWLQSRGEPVHGAATVRALVPVSVEDPAAGVVLASTVRACFVDLPVGEPSPIMRLEQLTFHMRRQTRGGRAIGARAIADIAGFAPTTLHHLGAQLGNAASRRFFNLVVTNVPGPQHGLFVAGSRMEISYPIIPLALGQALSVGLTSYDGMVGIGLNGDRAAMHDLELFSAYLKEAVRELASALEDERRERPWSPAIDEEPMSTTRVYLAVGEKGLAQFAADGFLPAGGVRGAAVTASVREAFPADDEEELEYDALLVAAEMVARDDPTGRVIVAAADIESESVVEVPPGKGVDGFEVALLSPVSVARLVSLHAAEAGASDDDELLWYDVSELSQFTGPKEG